MIGSDVVSLDGTAAGAFADKNVGAAKPVTVTGLSLTGADAVNYTLTQPTLSAAITQAGLTVTGLAAGDKVYDGTPAATLTGTAALVGVLGSDVVSLDGTAAGAFADENVGAAKAVTVTGLSLTGADAANYTLTQPTLSAAITQAGLTVTGLAAGDKVYDGTPAATLTGTAVLAGVLGSDVVSLDGTAAGAFADENVGAAKAVTVTGLSIIGANAANYALTQPTLSAAITQAGLTVTGLSADNKVYDGTTTATLTGTAVLAGVLGSDVVSLVGTAAGAFADANVGTSKSVNISGLSLTGADAANYSLTVPVATADITAAASSVLLVSSENPSAAGSNVTFTATVSSAAGTPAGDVVFSANGVPFSTNTLTVGIASASTTELPLGTNTVQAQYSGDGNFLADSASLDQVVEVPVVYSQTNTILSIVDNANGTLTLQFQGTPDAEYYVVSSSDVAAPVIGWTTIVASTNTAPSPSGIWSLIVTNSVSQQFYRSAAVNPVP